MLLTIGYRHRLYCYWSDWTSAPPQYCFPSVLNCSLCFSCQQLINYRPAGSAFHSSISLNLLLRLPASSSVFQRPLSISFNLVLFYGESGRIQLMRNALINQLLFFQNPREPAKYSTRNVKELHDRMMETSFTESLLLLLLFLSLYFFTSSASPFFFLHLLFYWFTLRSPNTGIYTLPLFSLCSSWLSSM